MYAIFSPAKGIIYFTITTSIGILFPSSYSECALGFKNSLIFAFYTYMLELAPVVLTYFMHNKIMHLIAQLEISEKKAQGELRRKTELVRTICHELRTPFNGVLGYLELLETMVQPGTLIYKYLKSAHSCCVNSIAMMSTILGIERCSIDKKVDLKE